MAGLTLQSLKKSFGALTVIPGVDLEVADGEFVVFVGPSGCGKSTILRLIAGLEEADEGDIRIGEESVMQTPAADRGVAMVFQSYALYPHMTVRQNLSFGLENIHMARDEIGKRVDRAAHMLQIENLLDRRPRQLSGGQRQRVAIGRAVTRDPKVFLFDEPLSNLDAELRVLMRAEITKLHERLENTMIYVTHDQIEAMTMANKIVVLKDGVIEQVGAPLELYNRPRNIFVAGFIGSPRMNFVPGEIKAAGGAVAFSAAKLPPLTLTSDATGLSDGEQATFGVRPEDLVISPDETGGWPLTVTATEQHGAHCYIHCMLADNVPVLIHQPGQSDIGRGDRLRVLPRDGRWHLFGADGLRIETRPG